MSVAGWLATEMTLDDPALSLQGFFMHVAEFGSSKQQSG